MQDLEEDESAFHPEFDDLVKTERER